MAFANLLLPPATKLGQGNIFTGVCDSVNRGMSAPGGGVCSWGCLLLGGVCSGGMSAPGVSTLGGGSVCSRGVSAPQEVCFQWGCLVETPRDDYCCGRYASYWNAFLFCKYFTENRMSLDRGWPGGGRPWRPPDIRYCRVLHFLLRFSFPI